MARKSPIENEPLSKLAELIKARPAEWWPVTARVPRFTYNNGNPETIEIPGIKHVSGVCVAGTAQAGTNFWIRWGEESQFVLVESRFLERFRKAVQHNLLARVERPIVHYDSAMEGLIGAAKSGDRTAAKALADFIMEAEG